MATKEALAEGAVNSDVKVKKAVVLKAVRALKQVVEKRRAHQNPLFAESTETMTVQFSISKIPERLGHPAVIPLPHPLYTDKSEVCFLSKTPQKKYKEPGGNLRPVQPPEASERGGGETWISCVMDRDLAIEEVVSGRLGKAPNGFSAAASEKHFLRKQLGDKAAPGSDATVVLKPELPPECKPHSFDKICFKDYKATDGPWFVCAHLEKN
eukprot:symbB.v1.2.034952.t1/scaffold4573.1/size40165/1